MAADEEPIHTIEDDITFEKMKHMPKRTAFYTAHRKLSWQYDKEIRQVERDKRFVTGGIERAQTSMAERLAKLEQTKKQLGITSEHVKSRRHSTPFMVTHHNPDGPQSEERDEKSNSNTDDDDEDCCVKNSAEGSYKIRRNTVAEGATLVSSLPSGRRFSVAEIHNSYRK